MHVLDAHNQYLLTLLAFAQAMAVEDSKTGVRLLRLRDQVENWQQMKPVLFDLLEQIMRTHVEFKMPPNLHPLALQYASDSPDVLLRLLIERKRNSWISTMALVRWTDYSPNIATEELAMREIVDRPMD
ncbi:MAG: hypothetical protein ABI758_00330 [Candidatus Woesebacteria bacterium]